MAGLFTTRLHKWQAGANSCVCAAWLAWTASWCICIYLHSSTCWSWAVRTRTCTPACNSWKLSCMHACACWPATCTAWFPSPPLCRAAKPQKLETTAVKSSLCVCVFLLSFYIFSSFSHSTFLLSALFFFFEIVLVYISGGFFVFLNFNKNYFWHN